MNIHPSSGPGWIQRGAVLATLAVLAACGSGNGYGSSGGATPQSGSASGPLATRDISGLGTVLVNSAGNTLYSAEQESDGSVVCLGSCLKFWLPVTSTSRKVTTPAGVSGQLGTHKRPDNGDLQVTYNGAPLYTFALDKGAGSAAGDGVSDGFGGISFTWHAATASGSKTTSSGSGDGGGSGGGYGGGSGGY